jgi:hypothetical protein
MRRHRTTGGVQMFSFLDAMVCTMGALLVLVHAFARHGQVQAVKSPEVQAARENCAAMTAEAETLDWRSAQLREVRDRTQAELADERQKLAHVEEHQRRLVAQLEELQIAARELERNGGSQSRVNEQVAAELDATKARIGRTQDELAEIRKSARDGNVNYSVVPYEGPHATRRRPIYIECRGDSIVLQPEGVELLPDDFSGYLGPGNPLAAAVRATSEYWAQQSPGAKLVEPYPLLLVRPEGIQSYYDARVALATWGSDFGYELIGGDWSLKFPERDERLAQVTREVVADAALRMRALVNSLAHMNRRRPRTALHASASGGFVEDRGHYGGGGRGSAGRGPSDWNDAGSGWARGEDSEGEAAPGAGKLAGRGGDMIPQGTGGGGSREQGLGSAAGSGSRGGAGEDFAMHGSRYADKPGGGGAEESNSGEGGAADSRDAQGGAENAAGGGQQSLAGRDAPQGGGKRGGKAGGPFGTTGGSPSDNPSNDDTAGGGSKYAGTARRGADTPSTARNDAATGAAGSAASSSSTSAAASSGMAGWSASSDSPSQSSSTGMPSPSLDFSAKKPRTASLAKARGNNWGLPESSGTAAATRPISVVCNNDSLVIMPEERGQSPVTVRLGPRTQESMDEFVSGVWQHMKGWGKAGKGLYWRPTLVVDVKPGAADRYAEVKNLLQDSGLDVHERVAATTAQPPASKPFRK